MVGGRNCGKCGGWIKVGEDRCRPCAKARKALARGRRYCDRCQAELTGTPSLHHCTACAAILKEARNAQYKRRQRAREAGMTIGEWARFNCPMIRAFERLADRSTRRIRNPRQLYKPELAAERYRVRYIGDPTFRKSEKIRTTVRRWINPEYPARYAESDSHRRYHTRRLEQMGQVTRRHLLEELTMPRCSYCLCLIDDSSRQLDHVDPVAIGGPHDDDNIIAACDPCNRSKGSTPLLIWIATSGL